MSETWCSFPSYILTEQSTLGASVAKEVYLCYLGVRVGRVGFVGLLNVAQSLLVVPHGFVSLGPPDQCLCVHRVHLQSAGALVDGLL